MGLATGLRTLTTRAPSTITVLVGFFVFCRLVRDRASLRLHLTKAFRCCPVARKNKNERTQKTAKGHLPLQGQSHKKAQEVQ